MDKFRYSIDIEVYTFLIKTKKGKIMSEKRKTINEILFDSTYYRNHCTDEYKDSILKDLLLADSGISYKEFIKKNIEELKKYSDSNLIV